MAAKVWGAQQKQAPPRAVDEIFFRNEQVSLCLLVNRRQKTMRVVDFRAGPTSAKRLFVLSLAKREGVEKVFTVVERDEVQTWVKLGFVKEGNIPAFYKRSDACILGCPASGRPERSGDVADADDVSVQSEMRMRVERVGSPGLPAPQALSVAHDRMERTILLAKRELKDGESALPNVKLVAIDEADTRKPIAAAQRSGRALTAFEPFGRDITRRYFTATARGGFNLCISIESQACFGNAHLELLQGPRTPAETAATTAAVRSLCDALHDEESVSCFALAPSDDVNLASVYLGAGFRRSGLLNQHLVVGGQRRDAILWSRKLAVPADE